MTNKSDDLNVPNPNSLVENIQVIKYLQMDLVWLVFNNAVNYLLVQNNIQLTSKESFFIKNEIAKALSTNTEKLEVSNWDMYNKICTENKFSPDSMSQVYNDIDRAIQKSSQIRRALQRIVTPTN